MLRPSRGLVRWCCEAVDSIAEFYHFRPWVAKERDENCMRGAKLVRARAGLPAADGLV